MKDNLMNHRLTLLLRSDVLGPDSRILHEGDGITTFVSAYKNIECSLQKRGVPFISQGIDDLDGIMHSHLLFGNTLIHNMCLDGENKFLIYMPENINSLDKGVIKGFVKELSGVEDVTLYQQVGEKHEPISVDEFLQPKQRKLDTIGQNTNSSNKKGLNIQ